MFEVTGTDIASLTDADLRTLVARLAIAELRGQNCPLSSVTAGGDQDAADGGIDVRVAAPALPAPDFVLRQSTGYQVKKPDMPPATIAEEMRPNGKLREAIADLAAEAGAYVIVSAQGSVADKPLRARKKAMRDALRDLPGGDQLRVDFYDRDRIATWVNEYPGIAAWVQQRSGRHRSGWRSVGNWTNTKVGEETEYLAGDKTCLIDERSKEREKLTIAEGIARLRSELCEPGRCVRLIGLSGLGKTRLLQALFESNVGDEPLDPGLAVYTDYSEETDPSARDMARALVDARQRAILVVDNCNPATHAELARICSTTESKVSLITVEYDVRDDEPERTEVFRLESASPELVADWLKQIFPDISQIDRERIGEFSDGNFRVARALAETLGKGETLGRLKSRELFVRIFQQRNEPDKSLLHAAEDLALLYSYDGSDTSADGELAVLAGIRGVGAAELYAGTAELRRRGLVQVRGRWRAILPHAIANPLAAFALERISPAAWDTFCATLPPRMLKSLSRRLGYLHDSAEAQAAVARWLQPTGPLGDLLALGEHGLEILANIAPVAPETVLAKIEAELDGANGEAILAPNNPLRWQWLSLIKALAYEPHMFEDAAAMLARFVAAEPPDHNNNTAVTPFTELFHLHLSGTRASPEQRRQAIRTLAYSGDAAKLRCASIALDALLEAGHFTSVYNLDFGARSRDWGWRPKIYKDIWDWFDSAVGLTLELTERLPDASSILARNVRNLWHFGGCHKALDSASAAILKKGPWIEGWLAFRVALKFDGKGMPKKARRRLVKIIDRLKPTDLLHQARAVVLSRVSAVWDVTDGEEEDGDEERPWKRASLLAQSTGRALAADPAVRRQFVPEVIAEQQACRAFECGRGLAEGSDDLASMWTELIDAYSALEPDARNATLLGGFIYGASEKDSAFCERLLDDAIDDPRLAPKLPYLQARVGMDETGIARLRKAIGKGVVSGRSFLDIANGIVGDAPPGALSELIRDIAELKDNGVGLALDILHMHFYRDREVGRERDQRLIQCGRDLLRRADFSDNSAYRDYGLRTVIKISLAGEDGKDAAVDVCRGIRAALEEYRVSSHDISYMLDGLFGAQPFVALDELLLPTPARRNQHLFDASFGFGTPLEKLDPSTLCAWADRDAAVRYPLLGQCLSMFKTSRGGDDEGNISPLFLDVLAKAPDKPAFLGDFWERIHPRAWSGSLADVLIGRRTRLKELETHPDASIRRWVADMQPKFEQWLETERTREREKEESFE